MYATTDLLRSHVTKQGDRDGNDAAVKPKKKKKRSKQKNFKKDNRPDHLVRPAERI